MKITRFEDIEAWQLARELCRQVYAAIAANSDFSKDWGLKDQITRAAGSVMDNVAEGFDGGSRPEFIRFLSYAQRSCAEVQSQLYRALDCGYINVKQHADLYELAAHARSKIGGLIRYLKTTKHEEQRTKHES